MDTQSFIYSMLSGLLNLHRDAEHGDGDKQEHAEECVDAFHRCGEVSTDRLNRGLDYSDIM